VYRTMIRSATEVGGVLSTTTSCACGCRLHHAAMCAQSDSTITGSSSRVSPAFSGDGFFSGLSMSDLWAQGELKVL
jgi:hypothetical protein